MRATKLNLIGGWGVKLAKAYDSGTDTLTVTVHSTVGRGSKGDKGDAGMAGAAGAAGLTWQGAWSAVTAYVVNDAVSYGGASYRRLVAGTTATTPDADPTRWAVVAAKGDAGAAGPAASFTVATSDPAVPATGQGYLNTATAQFSIFDGTYWWRTTAVRDEVSNQFDPVYEHLFGDVDLQLGFGVDKLGYEIFGT